jgi:hypothetical protein
MSNTTRPISEAERAAFIAHLRDIPNVVRAARLVGRTPNGFRTYRKLDPEFDKAWEEAISDGIEALEAELHRRAFEGIDKPVTFQGVITDSYKEYSDTLAMFLLKAHRPDKYRERSDVNHTVDAGLVERLAQGRARMKRPDDGSDLAG